MNEDIASLTARLASVEVRLAILETERPGRKAKPIVVSAAGICGVSPGIESSECPDASLYRRQKGCQGAACVKLAQNYYSNRRQRARG